jgi:LAO/AO transport system kinase
MDIIKEIRQGRPRAIAKAISLVENNGGRAQRLMKSVFACRRDALVVGITGTPGTGKSTLVDQMIGYLPRALSAAAPFWETASG